MGFRDSGFRNARLMRLNVLEDYVAAGRLTPDLRWATPLQ
jgi:hypothetical protein